MYCKLHHHSFLTVCVHCGKNNQQIAASHHESPTKALTEHAPNSGRRDQTPAIVGKIFASFSQLLVLQRRFNRPRGYKCLMV